MKKIFSTILLVSIWGLSSNAQIKKVPYRGAFAPAPTPAWTDAWTNFDPQYTIYPSTSAAPAGGSLIKVPSSGSGTVISTNTTWTKNNTYIINGLVYIKTGVTLTIEPGTVIFGGNAYANSSLIVTKGAKLIAEGTPTQPIVFTSQYPAGYRHPGDWGGIVILGKASYNGTSSATSPNASTTGLNYIEGITEVNNSATTGESTEFGGGASPVDDDSSGVLKYVRIEFGGYIFAQNKEINGVTFGAVGNKTVVDYVQCSFINDDAFEWFGGTVNCKHLISYRGVDDEWDTDNGFSGTVQFGLGIRDPQVADNSYSLASGGSNSEGYESDNDADGSSKYPRTKAIFANMTNIGPLRGDNSTTNLSAIHPSFRRAARIRRNSELKIFNSILSDYPTGLFIDNAAGNSAQNALDGKLKFKNNIVSGVKLGGLFEFASSGTAYPAGYNNYSSAKQFFTNNSNDSTLNALSYLTAPYGTASYPAAAAFTGADYRPIVGQLAASGSDYTDTAFTNMAWTADTCLAPASIGSISYAGTSYFSDSVRQYTLSSPYNPAADVRLIWTISGTGNSITSGQYNDSLTLKIKSAGTITCYAVNGCGATSVATLPVTVSCPAPANNTAIVGASYVVACDSVQLYRLNTPYSATDGVTMNWSLTGTTNSIVSGQSNDSVYVKIKAASTLTCTIVNVCGTTTVLTYPISFLSTVSAPASVTQTKISAVCGSTIYRYTAPVLPNGATGYQWILPSNSVSLGTVTRDSGNVDLTGRIIRVKYTSNTAQAVGDTIKVKYTWACGSSLYKAQALIKAAVLLPAAPASITATLIGMSSTSCGKVYRYTAPVLPTSTTTALPTGYKWNFVGNLGSTFVVDSGNTNLTGRVIRIRYTSSVASTPNNDSVYCWYISDCGDGARKGLALSITGFGVPAKPASVTITTIQDNCGGRIYEYSAPVLPTVTGYSTTAQPTGYLWTMPSGAVGATGTLVQGYDDLTQRTIRIRYTSNAAAPTTDSIYVRYNSNCGYGAIKGQKLSNLVKTGCKMAEPTTVATKTEYGSVETTIYPNPNPGIFTLTAKTGVLKQMPVTVKVINTVGNVVLTTVAQNSNGYLVSNISGANLTSGVYVLSFNIGNSTINTKFVVHK